MSDPIIEITAPPNTSPAGWALLDARNAQIRPLALAIIVLVLCFGRPLYHLAVFAFHSSFYSHILLIPFVALYIAWIKKDRFVLPSKPDLRWVFLPALLGLVTLGLFWITVWNGRQLTVNDSLALTTFSFVAFFVAVCAAFLSRSALQILSFPILFLFLLVPLPAAFEASLEMFFQHTSAVMSQLMLKASGLPVMRDGLLLRVPGMLLQVAPECSGIRSSLVLFITSLIAGHLFLRSPARRALLALFIVPLAIVRNGFRIFVIAQLCSRIGPEMIDSPIHKKGGPIFFLLSLIPFFLLLFFLRRSESRRLPHAVDK